MKKNKEKLRIINLHYYALRVYEQGATSLQWSNKNLFKNGRWTVMYKTMTLEYLYHAHKKQNN